MTDNHADRQSYEKISNSRSRYSKQRLDELSSKLKLLDELKLIPDVCIYAAGSYGRLEASKYSDIDLFFTTESDFIPENKINLSSIRLFAKVIESAESMEFPPFSNYGEYLKILYQPAMKRELGGRNDDFQNHFTSRMLLILESRPIFGDEVYLRVLKSSVESYFRDYDHHPDEFLPTFLVNDILRFWKTLCLNYEHGRNQIDARLALKQKIKNFKLKYSRLLTCFATISYLVARNKTISPNSVVEMCSLSPAERLRTSVSLQHSASEPIKKALDSYSWFLELTEKSKEELEEYFDDKSNRIASFKRAEQFGDFVFDALSKLTSDEKTLRYLVI